jgi:voltage-gated potassium channel Kch
MLLTGPIGIALLVLGSLLLGFWGFRSIDDSGLSIGDSLYRSMQLFYMDAQLPTGTSVPWQLEIARFLAPLAIASAALAAVLALLREQTQQFRTMLLARDHVVVVGLGSRGFRLLRDLRKTRRVVAIDTDGNSGAAKGLRRSGVAVIVGDARDLKVLRAARVDRASDVVVLVGSDSTTIEIVAALGGVVASRGRAAQHAAIDGGALWSELHRLPLDAGSANRRVEFFSIPDRTAAIVTEVAESAVVDSVQGSVTIRGEGSTVARLIVRLLRSERFASVDTFSLVSERPEAISEQLDATDAWVGARARIVEVSQAGADAAFAFVCGLPEAETLAEAAGIARRLPGTPVLAAVQDGDVEKALSDTGVHLRGVTLVPVLDEVLSERLLTRSAIEMIAMGRHADYLKQQGSRGETLEDNPSLLPWSDLPESLRESNRRFAEGVADALHDLGAELVPLSGSADGVSFEIPAEAVDRLAKSEHERWVRDHKRDGWRRTSGAKDPDLKLHPMLIPWDELTDAERDKDRDAIRAIPQLLASIGYELSLDGGQR